MDMYEEISRRLHRLGWNSSCNLGMCTFCSPSGDYTFSYVVDRGAWVCGSALSLAQVVDEERVCQIVSLLETLYTVLLVGGRVDGFLDKALRVFDASISFDKETSGEEEWHGQA